MGLFKKAKRFFKKNKGAAMGAALGPAGIAAGALLVDKRGGGLKDLLFGKKESGPDLPSDVKDVQALARQNQAMGLRELQTAFEQPAEKSAEIAANQELAASAAANQDARLKMQEAIVRRGLGNTSMGLGAENTQEREMAQQRADIQNTMGQRIEAERLKRSQAFLGGGGDALTRQGDVYIKPKAQRPGGIAGLIGMGAGAYFGGPQGAMMGKGIGDAAGQAFG